MPENQMTKSDSSRIKVCPLLIAATVHVRSNRAWRRRRAVMTCLLAALQPVLNPPEIAIIITSTWVLQMVDRSLVLGPTWVPRNDIGG